jgi:hypothetical protein
VGESPWDGSEIGAQIDDATVLSFFVMISRSIAMASARTAGMRFLLFLAPAVHTAAEHLRRRASVDNVSNSHQVSMILRRLYFTKPLSIRYSAP